MEGSLLLEFSGSNTQTQYVNLAQSEGDSLVQVMAASNDLPVDFGRFRRTFKKGETFSCNAEIAASLGDSIIILEAPKPETLEPPEKPPSKKRNR